MTEKITSPSRSSGLAGLEKAAKEMEYPKSPPPCPRCGRIVAIWDLRGGYCSETGGGCGLWTFPNKEDWLEERLNDLLEKINGFEAGHETKIRQEFTDLLVRLIEIKKCEGQITLKDLLKELQYSEMRILEGGTVADLGRAAGAKR